MKKNSSRKNQTKIKVKRNINIGRINTIFLTVITVITLIVCIVILGLYTFSRNIIRGMQNELSADIITNLQVFQQHFIREDFKGLQEDLNGVLSGSYIVKYIQVFDSNMKPVYSTLPEDCEYELVKSANNREVKYRLTFAPDFNLNKLKIIDIKKSKYKFYIGIEQSDFITNCMLEYKNNIIQLTVIILLLTLILSILLSMSISKPLSVMEKTISKISEGDLSGRLDYTNYYELNQLVQSYNVMVNELQKMYSTLEVEVQDRTKELKNAYTELQNTQAMMVHSEKMKSLGELVAGIMHEINNPINFIYGNMTHLSNYSNDLIELIDDITANSKSLNEEERTAFEKKKEELDYEFLKTDMPDLIKSCKEGADRAKNIIQDLKSFSRMEEAAITDIDVVHEIDTTLNILHNKIKNKAVVHKEYTEPIPKIEGYGGQLNQVFMNILDNAAGAIEKQGDIWIRIMLDNSYKNLIIEIEDNGIGMDKETAMKVFDPFFTTKPVGQGTGLGMSITHKIIKNHQGNITVSSNKGQGTKFTITLPLTIDRELLNAGLKQEGEAV